MQSSDQYNICVLLGGESGERQVSLDSGTAIAAALLRLGHTVRLLDIATGRSDLLGAGSDPAGLIPAYAALTPDPRLILESLQRLDPAELDLAAVLLHGGCGEDGRLQSVLELMGIAYTGSGPSASSVTMDKILAKRVAAAEGIPVPRDALWNPGSQGCVPPREEVVESLGGYPVVVKPIDAGSSLGVTIVAGPDGWDVAWEATAGLRDPHRGVMLEEYVDGRELTVGFLGDHVLPVVEIVPKTAFYDYRRKYTKGETEYIVPADLPADSANRLQQWAERAFRTTGCRDLGRVDFRMDHSGRAAFLEVNTVPGMTSMSLVPMAARAVGIEFDELAEILCRRALSRRRESEGQPGGVRG